MNEAPYFYVVYQISSDVWASVAYWTPGEANRRAHALRALGHMAFVEAR